MQLYGVPWSATGIDQFYPETYERAQTDFDANDSFYDIKQNKPLRDQLSLDILDAGLHATNLPIILVNEPILVSNGKNSDIRYNFFYPRWAYDEYRVMLSEYTAQQNIPYLDLWDLVPMDEFTNSGVHLTPFGESLLAEQVGDAIKNICE
ncbi:MAG: hypothetical protein U0X87_16760 [Anaerolineales bacterium]